MSEHSTQIYNTIPKVINHYQEINKLTLRGLARELGVSVAMLSYWKNAANNPNVDTLLKILWGFPQSDWRSQFAHDMLQLRLSQSNPAGTGRNFCEENTNG